MKREATLTSIRSLRDEEERLLAENGLKAERTIAVLRTVLQLGRIASFVVTAQVQGAFDGGQIPGGIHRPIAVVLYTTFCVFVLWGVYTRATPNVGQSKFVPLLLISVDFGFLAFMGLTPAAYDQGAQLQNAAMFSLILMAFGALRLRDVHIVYASVLAALVYSLVVANTVRLGEHIEPVPVIFTYVTIGVMTALVLQLSARVRQMFHTLRTRDNLRRFLPKAVADRVERSHMHALDPVKREVTVLFSDIRDFTATSETMDPAAVMKFLDDYFGRMSAVVQARGGTVGKFIGDGMLCYWGVPEEDAAHAEHAVQAALDMRAVVEELNRERSNEGLPQVKIGVGVHTGTVAAGELGGKGEGLHEYTVIGDSVNLASRIEGLTKQHQVDILVSEVTWSLLGERFVGHPCGEERVKGRAEPVRVHAVTARTVASGSALS